MNYIIEHGQWGENEKKDLELLRGKMNELFNKIKPARHKLICHNDKESIINGTPLGSFDRGIEKEYFRYLQEFLDIIQTRYLEGPCEMGVYAIGDADVFLKCIFADYHNRRKREEK